MVFFLVMSLVGCSLLSSSRVVLVEVGAAIVVFSLMSIVLLGVN